MDHNGKLVSAWGPWTDMPAIQPMLQEALDDAVKASISPEYILDADAMPQHHSGQDNLIKEEL